MRPMCYGILVAGAFLFGLACGGGPTDVTPSPQQSAVIGHWAYNQELSDNPQDLFGRGDGPGGGRAVGPSGGGGRGGGRGGGGRRGGAGGGRGPGGGNRPSAEDMERMQQLRGELRQARRRLTISLADSNLVIGSALGERLRLVPNNEGVESESRLGKVQTKAQWKDRGVRIERKYDGGFKLTEFFETPEGSEYLYHTLKLEGGMLRQPVEIRRVYDRIEADDL